VLEEEDDQPVPPPSKLPTLAALHEAIAAANEEDAHLFELIDGLKSLFSTPNAVVIPFVRIKPSDEVIQPTCRPLSTCSMFHVNNTRGRARHIDWPWGQCNWYQWFCICGSGCRLCACVVV
jgi:hypothetical protein